MIDFDAPPATDYTVPTVYAIGERFPTFREALTHAVAEYDTHVAKTHRSSDPLFCLCPDRVTVDRRVQTTDELRRVRARPDRVAHRWTVNVADARAFLADPDGPVEMPGGKSMIEA